MPCIVLGSVLFGSWKGPEGKEGGWLVKRLYVVGENPFTPRLFENATRQPGRTTTEVTL